MNAAINIPAVAITHPPGIQPGSGVQLTPPFEAVPPIEGVIVTLSPEAIAVLEGALEPAQAVAEAMDLQQDGESLVAARDQVTGDGVFNLYGDVDIDGDGETDGPAGAAETDDGDPLAEDAATGTPAAEEAERKDDPSGLTSEEREIINKMAARDAEVRAHEMAHMAAGGGLTSGMSFSYETGPDGQRYAVGGEVGIDTSPGATPEETVTKAQRIRAAAMAPADPSPQDRSVASRATQMEQGARAELAADRQEETAKATAESGGSTVRGSEEPSEVSEVAHDQATEADGHEFTPTLIVPDNEGTDADDGPQVQDAADPATVNRATLAQFESGNAAQAAQFGLPAPDNALVSGPIDENSVAFTFVR
jgi:hypothetical protein